MIKGYIVLHDDGRPALIRKDSIDAIIKLPLGNTGINYNGRHIDVDETYEEVVRKLFK